MIKRLAVGAVILAMVGGCSDEAILQMADRIRKDRDSQPAAAPTSSASAALPSPTTTPAASAAPVQSPSPSSTPSPSVSPSPSPKPTATAPTGPFIINRVDGRDFSIGIGQNWAKSGLTDKQFGDLGEQQLVCHKTVDGVSQALLSVSSWTLLELPLDKFIDLVKKTFETGDPTFVVERNYQSPYSGFRAKGSVIGSLPLIQMNYRFFFISRQNTAYMVHIRWRGDSMTEEQVIEMVDSFRMR